MKVILTAAVTLLLLIGAMPAMADTSTTTFEDFGLGTVNGQDGWKVGGGGAVYDQQVVTPGLVGLRALRMSNAVTSGSFEDQTFSKPVADPAGENVANKGYTGEFTFLSTTPDAQQQGLAMSVSPDNAHGARMSDVRLEAGSAPGIAPASAAKAAVPPTLSSPCTATRRPAAVRKGGPQHTQNGPPSVASRKYEPPVRCPARGASRLPSP